MASTASTDLVARASRFRVLGVSVDAVQIPEVIRQMEKWIGERDGTHFIAVTNVDSVMQAWHSNYFRQVLAAADLAVPDGMPLVWLGRMQGYAMRRRVCGRELMEAFCRDTGPRFRHFFYGGAPGVADRLAEVLEKRYGVHTVGTYCPPFRPLTELERVEAGHRIEAAAPDVVWVGLGCPKQERWMYEHRRWLSVPLMVGVGAAFNFIAGTLDQAPTWMQEDGLEWLFRLAKEPTRLWRRYLINGSKFVWNVSFEVLGLKKFE